MGRITAFTTGSLLGLALLTGATDAHESAGLPAAPTLVSDSFAGYAVSTPIGIGGHVRFARGTALRAVPVALAQPIAAPRTEWRT